MMATEINSIHPKKLLTHLNLVIGICKVKSRAGKGPQREETSTETSMIMQPNVQILMFTHAYPRLVGTRKDFVHLDK